MSLDEVALIMDYGGVKGGREGAIAAMHELRQAKEREIADQQKAYEAGGDGKGADAVLVEDVAQLDTDSHRRGA